jgi:guanylate kinase
MSKIFMLMGKSASGKDTIYQKLMKIRELNFKKVLMYTTRPVRKSETDGVEYHFVSKETLMELSKQNKIIEYREYDTIQGRWYYFTADDGKINLDKDDYLMIGTLEAYVKLKEYFGNGKVIPLYLEVEDGTRLIRAVIREQKQEHPQYAEVCRRYMADQEDFSDENLKKNGIYKRYHNEDIQACLYQLISDIKNFTVYPMDDVI